MYIQLTRMDGRPIWLNASFIVTIEPTQGGGAIVVPIGDGLDYEVRESPSAVLGMLDGAPAATVVPVPPPKSLAPAFTNASPGEMEASEIAYEQKEEARKPAKAPAKARKTAGGASGKRRKDSAPAKTPADADAQNAQAAVPDASGASDAPSAAPADDDPVAQIGEKLRAHKCRTEKRLLNFIMSSNKGMSDAEAAEAMEEMKRRGYFKVEGDGRVVWP